MCDVRPAAGAAAGDDGDGGIAGPYCGLTPVVGLPVAVVVLGQVCLRGDLLYVGPPEALYGSYWYSPPGVGTKLRNVSNCFAYE